MNKKIIKILSVVFIFIVAIFVIYNFDSVNRRKESMLDVAERLIDSISYEEYDKIGAYVKKIDGTELSQQELSNFLLNTGLYRVMFYNNEEPTFTYSTSVNFLNHDKGTLTLSFIALDGDLITNEIKYVNTGVDEYFVTDDIEESGKEVKRFPFDSDLKNGEEMGFKNDVSEDEAFFTYLFTQDEIGDFYLAVFEESKDDLRIAMFNMLESSLKDKENEYRYTWNNDCSLVSVYYSADELSFIKKLHIGSSSVLCAVTIQALNENSNWHLTIKYYDYNTEELLSTEIIR